MMQRRGFLAGILAAGMAPAIARSGILMPIYVPRSRFDYEFNSNTFGAVAGIIIREAATGVWCAGLAFRGPHPLHEGDILNIKMSLRDGEVQGAGSWEAGPGGILEMKKDPLEHMHPSDFKAWPFARR